MNNILDNAIIERLSNGDTAQALTLFKTATDDNDSTQRNQERLGINNRLKLKSATQYKYGRNTDGIPVLIRPDSKKKTEDIRNHKNHKRFGNIITLNKSGYLSGFTVESKSGNDTLLETIKEFLDNNHFEKVFTDKVKKCTGYGKQSLRLYLEKNGEVRTSELDPWNYAPFYNKTGDLSIVLQWTKITKDIEAKTSDNTYSVMLTTAKSDLHFVADMTNSTMTIDSTNYPEMVVENTKVASDGERPHGFNSVPIIEFKNNQDELGDVEGSINLQDSYDELLSKASSTWGAFADMLIRDKTPDSENISIEDFAENMRDYGIVTGDMDFISRSYAAYQDLKAHLQLLENNIYESSNSYNPNALGGDGSSPTKYQIQQKMKLLIDSTVDTENQFTGAFRQLFKLVLTAGFPPRESDDYKDLKVKYTHTIPEDKMLTLEQMLKAGTKPSNQDVLETAGKDYDTWLTQTEEDNKIVMSALGVEDEETDLLNIGVESIEGATIGEEGAGVQMNGAQVSSAVGIVEKVVGGIIPKPAGLNMLKSFFNLSDIEASDLFAGVVQGSVNAE